MRKYKLIKEYPGSPKLGTEIFNDEIFKGHYYIYRNGIKTSLGTIEPYKYPEFWEEVVEDPIVYHIGKSLTDSHPGGNTPYYIYADRESYCKKNNIKYFYCKKDCKKWANEQVVEKDYEILSFYHNNKLFSKLHHRSSKTFPYWSNEGTWVSYDKFCKIHSVKRLSDGEIFTVGDKVKFQGNGCSDITIILKFELVNNKVHAHSGSASFHINFIHHIKKPLFTTEDGVDIYKGDKVWYINLHTNNISKNHETVTSKYWDFKNYKYFSTKEAAEEYILMNKPCLSANEVIQYCIDNYKTVNDHRTYKLLKKLVKSKL